ncbi:MAG TPA: Gfo/Idh/MocA family oxidoreductase [Longimicrobiales bacterium]
MIGEQQLRAAVREDDALHAAELAFTALGQGAATVPAPVGLAIHDRNGELHIKCAYLHGSRFFVVKAATGFYDNAAHGLPSGSGLMLLFDSNTGFPLALLQDNGYLTELRTAAAGTLAARLLAIMDFARLAVIGAGTQARYHLRAFQNVFDWRSTAVWSRSHEHAQQLCAEMRGQLRCELAAAETVEAAVRGADVIITVTPSQTPLVRAEWLEPHATIIAVGADEPAKQELDASVFTRAGRVVVDSAAQCARLGELHHALDAGLVRLKDCTELGEILSGRKLGRLGQEMIVCDLTGVGAQDAAIAELAYRACAAEAHAL